MTRRNDLVFVRETMSRLDAAGVRTWLFGGWAEELLGLTTPREHHDVDLLYPAADFSLADTFIAAHGRLLEITQKRHAHKRAFLRQGIMIELTLVGAVAADFTTEFWGENSYVWPADLLGFEATDSASRARRPCAPTAPITSG